MEHGIQTDMILDCLGLHCPLPILHINKAIKELQKGQILKMLATDPDSIKDIEDWSARTGNSLVESKVEDGQYIYYVQKN